MRACDPIQLSGPKNPIQLSGPKKVTINSSIRSPIGERTPQVRLYLGGVQGSTYQFSGILGKYETKVQR
jgi:hypothetical protein